MGQNSILERKGDIMKSINLNKCNFLTVFFSILVSVAISVFLSTWFTMHYMTHIYTLQSIDAKTFMNVSKRIDLLEAEIKARHSLGKKPVKPVML